MHLPSLISGVVPKVLEVRITPLAAVEISCCRIQFYNVWSQVGCCVYSYLSKKNPSCCGFSSCALDFFNIWSYDGCCTHNYWSKKSTSHCSILSWALDLTFLMSGVMADVMRITVFVRRTPLLAVFSGCTIIFFNIWS